MKRLISSCCQQKTNSYGLREGRGHVCVERKADLRVSDLLFIFSATGGGRWCGEACKACGLLPPQFNLHFGLFSLSAGEKPGDNHTFNSM